MQKFYHHQKHVLWVAAPFPRWQAAWSVGLVEQTALHERVEGARVGFLRRAMATLPQAVVDRIVNHELDGARCDKPTRRLMNRAVAGGYSANMLRQCPRCNANDVCRTRATRVRVAACDCVVRLL